MFGMIFVKGFYICYVCNIILDNVNFYYEKVDGCFLFVMDDVSDIRYRNIIVDGKEFNIVN